MSDSDWIERVQLLGPDGAPLRISSSEEASAVRMLLAANGIVSELSELSTAFHQLPAHLVLVPADQAEEAARIIAEVRANGPQISDEAERAGETTDDLPPDGI